MSKKSINSHFRLWLNSIKVIFLKQSNKSKRSKQTCPKLVNYYKNRRKNGPFYKKNSLNIKGL